MGLLDSPRRPAPAGGGPDARPGDCCFVVPYAEAPRSDRLVVRRLAEGRYEADVYLPEGPGLGRRVMGMYRWFEHGQPAVSQSGAGDDDAAEMPMEQQRHLMGLADRVLWALRDARE